MKMMLKALITILLFIPDIMPSLKADESLIMNIATEIYTDGEMQSLQDNDISGLNLYMECGGKHEKVTQADVILVSKEEPNVFAVKITLVPENEHASEHVGTFIAGNATTVFRNNTTKAPQVAKVRDFTLTPADPTETILVGYPFPIAGNYETLVGLNISAFGRIKHIEEKVFLNGKEIASATISAQSQVSRYKFTIR